MFRIIKLEPIAQAEYQAILLPRNATILTAVEDPLSLVIERDAESGGELEGLEILLLAPNNEHDLTGWTYLTVIHGRNFCDSYCFVVYLRDVQR